MKKILFGITSLTLGGAERVLVDIANKLCNEYDINILTIYDNGELKKQLNEKIKVNSIYPKQYKDYNKIQKILISLKLLLFNLKISNEYDTYIAFLEGPITRAFSKIGNKRKNKKERNSKKQNKIAWVHNDISKVFGKGLKAKLKLLLGKSSYKKYDKIIFVSEENKNDFIETYGKLSEYEVIRNFLDYKSIIKKAEEKIDLPFNKNDINLVTVCRLVDQKAIDRYIKIHAKLESEGIHSKVYIVGDGPQRYNLQKIIDNYEETENFYLLGATENPYPYMKNADFFCLLSYYEGYGMVLDEAKILGKSIIITDTAAKESLEDYYNSVILDNTEKGIYEGLKNIITNIDSNLKDESDKKDKKNSNEMEKIEKYYNEIIEEINKLLE